jgi:benzoylformate decarboxylase
MKPESLLAALAEARPADAIVVQESTSSVRALHEFLPMTRPGSYFSAASAALGWGLPAAVGVALAQKDALAPRPVIAIIGDGALQYSIQALWTAVETGVELTVLVPSNAEYAILKAFAAIEGNEGVPGLDWPAFDIGALAAAYGCLTERAEDPDAVREAVSRSVGSGRTTVIAAPISPEVPPLL